MYFIGNTCFRRKIVYHNKMHLHYSSLKERVAPSSIKLRTYVFKKVSFTERNYTCFPNSHKRALISKIKASILWCQLCYHIWYHIFYASIFIILIMNWISRSQLFAVMNTNIPKHFLTSNAFLFSSASAFLNFSSVECQMLLR